MKITLLFTKFFPVVGGAETYYYQLAQGLHERGHEVTVITSPHPEREREYFAFKILEVEGFNEECVEINKAIPQLYHHMKNENPDIIHVHNYLPYYLLQALSKTKLGNKIIFTVHNTPYANTRVFGFFNDYHSERLLASKVLDEGSHDAIIVGSNYYKSSIDQLSTRKQNIKVIPYAVDTTLFNPGNHIPTENIAHKFIPELRKNPNEVLILYPSRVVQRKGIDVAIKALTYLPPKFKLMLTTTASPKDIELYQKLKELIRNESLETRVLMCTQENEHSELPGFYHLADLVVYPSKYEGFGLISIEAMAMEKPIIGSDVPAINEVIKDKENGLLFTEGDPKSLAKAILSISNDPKLYKKLVEGGKKSVKEDYNLNTHIERVLFEYESTH
jgi:glycosyltransferase involved in cell wall biosynthesis